MVSPSVTKKTAMIFVFMALSLTACSNDFVRRGTAPSPKPSQVRTPHEYAYSQPPGSPAVDQATTPSPQPSPQMGKMVITVRDQNQNTPAFIPVRIIGAVNEKLETNGRGQVTFEGPTGHYRFEAVVGCTGRLIVSFGGSGSGGIVGGTTATGTLQVKWRHRITAGDGTYPSHVPNWPRGETISVSFDVIDRCTEELLPLGPYPTWTFRPSPNLEVVGTPELRADEKGKGHVQVRCKDKGDVELFMIDTANPTDQIELVQYIFFVSEHSSSDRIRCT